MPRNAWEQLQKHSNIVKPRPKYSKVLKNHQKKLKKTRRKKKEKRASGPWLPPRNASTLLAWRWRAFRMSFDCYEGVWMTWRTATHPFSHRKRPGFPRNVLETVRFLSFFRLPGAFRCDSERSRVDEGPESMSPALYARGEELGAAGGWERAARCSGADAPQLHRNVAAENRQMPWQTNGIQWKSCWNHVEDLIQTAKETAFWGEVDRNSHVQRSIVSRISLSFPSILNSFMFLLSYHLFFCLSACEIPPPRGHFNSIQIHILCYLFSAILSKRAWRFTHKFYVLQGGSIWSTWHKSYH